MIIAIICICEAYHTTLLKHQITLICCYVVLHHSLVSFHWPLVTQAELAVFAAEGSRWWAVCTHMMTNFLWKHPQYHRTVGGGGGEDDMTTQGDKWQNIQLIDLLLSWKCSTIISKFLSIWLQRYFQDWKKLQIFKLTINELLYFGETLFTAVLT